MNTTEYAQESLSLLNPFIAPLEQVRGDALDNNQIELVGAVERFLSAYGHAAVITNSKHATEAYAEVALSELEEALENLTEVMQAYGVSTKLITRSQVVYTNA